MERIEHTDGNVSRIICEVIEEMCDSYCKWPEEYRQSEEGKMYDERCNSCPLNKLG
ncbi:MAG: hypothetical protein IJ188_06535 [Clostridia bacterium]|nr:hypothetical protein [Clostridia bacterium]